MLDCCAPIEKIKVEGVTLYQLACIASYNQLEASIVCADDTGMDEFRSITKVLIVINGERRKGCNDCNANSGGKWQFVGLVLT